MSKSDLKMNILKIAVSEINDKLDFCLALFFFLFFFFFSTILFRVSFISEDSKTYLFQTTGRLNHTE